MYHSSVMGEKIIMSFYVLLLSLSHGLFAHEMTDYDMNEQSIIYVVL